MGKQKFNYRFTLKPNGKVFARVRWASRTKEVAFCLNVSAEPSKWDSDSQRAIRNTTHNVRGIVFPARIINKEIDRCIDLITDYFTKCEVENTPTSTITLKEYVVSNLQPAVPKVQSMCEIASKLEVPNVDELFKTCMIELGKERNWSASAHRKYHQTWNLLKTFLGDFTIDSVDGKTCLNFKVWLIEQGYKNSSVTKYFRYIKCVFKWFRTQGYSVSDSIFTFKTNLSVPIKNVIFLTFDELYQLKNCIFPAEKQYLSRTRDMFLFMSYTSLRYSDLKALKKADVSDGYINIYAQKTKGRLRIPLAANAMEIYKRYKDTTVDDHLFNVPSNQKLNVFIKEAAEYAGLCRKVVTTTFCGSEKIERIQNLHDALSCHCARRTFVCVSLALGIPQSVVMSITGHADYESMRPYISISDETSRRELIKWELESKRTLLYRTIDALDDEQLEKILRYAERLAK